MTILSTILFLRSSMKTLRHSMAAAMLNNGADIRYIQLMLGHASLRTTQIYTQVSNQALKDVHSKTHPATMKTEEIEPNQPE